MSGSRRVLARAEVTKRLAHGDRYLEHPDPVALDAKDPRVPQLTTYGLLIAKR